MSDIPTRFRERIDEAQRGRVHELVQRGREVRPDVAWDSDRTGGPLA